jgi:hypothetical protein
VERLEARFGDVLQQGKVEQPTGTEPIAIRRLGHLG